MALYAFDGTWNRDKPGADQDTNAVWFYNAYTGAKQYWAGVGTRLGFVGKVFGGINRAGGHERIKEALDLLKKNFAAGDTVVDVVGFSRGAAIAVDFANKVGRRTAPAGGQPPAVRFLGVWDVVGSFDGPGNDLDVGFDLKTPPTAQCIRHCMALDERRLFFPLTRLTGSRPSAEAGLMEVWFRGVHSDVGGGDMAQGLSSISLNFMFTQASMAGLPLDPAVVRQNVQRVNPDFPISLHPEHLLEQLQPFRTLTINDLVHFSVKPREDSQGRHHSNPPQELARVNDAGELGTWSEGSAALTEPSPGMARGSLVGGHAGYKDEGEGETESEGSAAATAPSSELARSPFVGGPAGYTSEFCGVGGTGVVSDCLSVGALAVQLAELMALRETKLPLAVGLFGNWGSGKSHFMNLIDRHMKKLASQDAAEGTNRADEHGIAVGSSVPALGPWCREIVPIYFNAWHYSDTNLWASLVTEVFDGLFAHLQPKQDELDLMRSRLRDADGTAARAEEEVNEAQEAVRKATARLQLERTESEGAHQAVRSLMDGLLALVPQANTTENERKIEEWLGVSAEDATLSQLTERGRELAALRGRLKELWRRATASEGLSQRLWWFCAALILIGIGRLAAAGQPQIETLLRRAGPWVQAGVAAIGSLMAWMAPAFKQVSQELNQMEAWQRQAEEAQAKRPEDPTVIAARERMLRAQARAVEAETSLAEARALVQKLTQSVDDLRPERRLSRFIEARARSADYRGQLGLVSLARKDFQELSNIFADSEVLQLRIKEHPEQAVLLERLGSSVDRIVLFVDDLDRCQPETVVDVLQAIHLLLAYPLFGVFVGVDQRCLKQSLRMSFRGLLTPDHEGYSKDGKTPRRDPADLLAKPLDYLEKIFHIPFHLPPLDESGFRTLVEKLTEPNTRSASSGAEPKTTDADSETRQVVSTPTEGPSGTSQHHGETITSATWIPEGEVRDRAVLGSVPLYRWERDALKEYHSVIRTPRAATRLLNTYRLVRAGVSLQEWDDFRGDDGGRREFRVAMVLLSAAAGHPAVAREWFGLLRNLDASKGTLPNQLPGTGTLGWSQFRKLYDYSIGQMTDPLTPALLTKWIDRVERFAF